MGGQQAVDAWKFARERHAEWPHTSFLAELDEPVLRDFISTGEFVRFSKGDVLLSESVAAPDAFLLLDACVKVTAQLDAGRQALLAIRVGGDIVGEIAIMDGGDRTATVIACAHEALRGLREDGLISHAGRRLLVPDLAALHSAAWPGQPKPVFLPALGHRHSGSGML